MYFEGLKRTLIDVLIFTRNLYLPREHIYG